MIENIQIRINNVDFPLKGIVVEAAPDLKTAMVLAEACLNDCCRQKGIQVPDKWNLTVDSNLSQATH